MISAPIDANEVDQDLKQRVSGYLSSRQMYALRKLDVEAGQGVVTLTGQVASFHEKQVALNVCRRVAGVYDLVDHVEVVGT